MSCDEDCQKKIMGMAQTTAGVFTLCTWGISFFQIVQHLRHYTNNKFQNKILTIIFMAPFYALTSFLTIYSRDEVGYFALFRDLYESVLIYAFFHLLSLYLTYDAETGEIEQSRIYEALATKGVKEHLWPMNHVWRPMILVSTVRAQWFYKKAELNVLQYLAIKPTVTFLQIIIVLIDKESVVILLLKGIVFFSVMFSVYYLVLFYQLLKEELAFAKPLLKFLAVKGVLFFTFWQDFVIAIFKKQILSQFVNLKYDEEFIIAVCENILVCFEMIILSSMTIIAFSYQDFKNTEKHGFFVKKEGIKHLTKKLLTEVIAENVTEALIDLKELKEPLKDPFKKYKDKNANIERGKMLTMVDKQEKGLLPDDIHQQVRVTVYEAPLVVPNFVTNGDDSLMESDEEKNQGIMSLMQSE